jgi:hypothetical protein
MHVIVADAMQELQVAEPVILVVTGDYSKDAGLWYGR